MAEQSGGMNPNVPPTGVNMNGNLPSNLQNSPFPPQPDAQNIRSAPPLYSSMPNNAPRPSLTSPLTSNPLPASSEVPTSPNFQRPPIRRGGRRPARHPQPPLPSATQPMLSQPPSAFPPVIPAPATVAPAGPTTPIDPAFRAGRARGRKPGRPSKAALAARAAELEGNPALLATLPPPRKSTRTLKGKGSESAVPPPITAAHPLEKTAPVVAKPRGQLRVTHPQSIRPLVRCGVLRPGTLVYLQQPAARQHIHVGGSEWSTEAPCPPSTATSPRPVPPQPSQPNDPDPLTSPLPNSNPIESDSDSSSSSSSSSSRLCRRARNAVADSIFTTTLGPALPTTLPPSLCAATFAQTPARERRQRRNVAAAVHTAGGALQVGAFSPPGALVGVPTALAATVGVARVTARWTLQWEQNSLPFEVAPPPTPTAPPSASPVKRSRQPSSSTTAAVSTSQLPLSEGVQWTLDTAPLLPSPAATSILTAAPPAASSKAAPTTLSTAASSHPTPTMTLRLAIARHLARIDEEIDALKRPRDGDSSGCDNASDDGAVLKHAIRCADTATTTTPVAPPTDASVWAAAGLRWSVAPPPPHGPTPTTHHTKRYICETSKIEVFAAAHGVAPEAAWWTSVVNIAHPYPTTTAGALGFPKGLTAADLQLGGVNAGADHHDSSQTVQVRRGYGSVGGAIAALPTAAAVMMGGCGYYHVGGRKVCESVWVPLAYLSALAAAARTSTAP